ncbi:hypothetical protein J40TS1_09220 [Paenibacillus montaniterrae]|uniref:ABC transporter substrate-binding protein n=1 Tax=Paenibacillus montaniterrae TaxID=429341 RepID=A0A919YLA3_9BACL|nr:zinc ABC transporter substrate-binding protein [Paenibacillus montaniterrae]GIP15280.1 hypothetical protein J40TS1_09220 [Paenibacillus montaniterrae]
MMNKKIFSVLLIACLLFVAACGNNEKNSAENSSDARLNVVTSFYPIYYLTQQIGGDQVKVTNLIATGVEPHDWSPKSKDLLTASAADLLLYHGVGLETWIDSFVNGLEKDSKVVIKEVSGGIDIIDTTAAEEEHDHAHEGEAATEEHDHAHEGEAATEEHDHAHEEEAATEEHDHAHEEEAATEEHDHAHEGEAATEEHDHAHEGEAATEEHDHAHEEEAATEEHDHGHSHDHSHGLDPHTWVSPKSALILASNIKDSLVEVDPENSAVYEQNYETLREKLAALDERYEQELANVSLRTIVVSHQSFGYVARDYNLKQISIMGLSPSAEPRAQDIKNIADLVKEEGVRVIFFEELVSDKLAKMLASEAKVDTNVIHSLEGLTTKEEQDGQDYLTLMERNLQNLVEALQ